ncbi:protein kinase [Pseudomonas sp. HAR-UPW-AIA-41]|uniref:protein kinase n=1 Tax=Pseudomonas sp. HAR-UPW-AIA-41 TaxID=1985301 RepID=UPI000BB34F53|nr:protein kinase [Pseudomonas sp. HAR-UPW-AIA-41]PAV48148.1 protein kinase [Pseudomonas sp. HAR-UPW-AIA-41]
MTIHCLEHSALHSAVGHGPDLPEQAARIEARWLAGRSGRPAVLLLALLWGRRCPEVVHFLERSLSALFADYQATPQAWSETQALRQVLSALNQQLFTQRGSGALLPEVSAGVLLLQGDEATFMQVGDCGLLRWREGVLQSLNGRESAPLGVQAELGLIQHSLPLSSGEFLLLAPQPLLAVADLELFSAGCRTATPAGLTALLQPLLVAPGAAAVVRTGSLAPVQLPAPVEPLPVLAPLAPGESVEGWTVLAPVESGPSGRLWWAEQEGERVWLWLAEQPVDELFRQREWVLRRAPCPGLPVLLPRAEPRRHALQVLRPLPGRVLSLAQWRREHARPSAAQVLALLRPLLTAVRALQRRGVLGLVLDPQLILLNEQGRVCLLPEQAACWPGVPRQSVASTPLPLAPEVRNGQPLDGRCDQFALAALCYWLLGGEWPSLALVDTPQQVRYEPLAEAGRQLPNGWDGVLARALAPQPRARFDALSEFLQALERPLNDAGRSEPQVWPQPWRFALLGVLMAQLLLALLVTLI